MVQLGLIKCSWSFFTALLRLSLDTYILRLLQLKPWQSTHVLSAFTGSRCIRIHSGPHDAVRIAVWAEGKSIWFLKGDGVKNLTGMLNTLHYIIRYTRRKKEII